MLYETIQTAAEFLCSKTSYRPKTAIILGSGLGKLGEELTDAVFIPYADIPGFPPSSVEGHAARLVFGRLRDREIAVMQGRFHYYEGLTMQEVTFPVYVLHAMGVDTIVLTNACGGINTAFSPGDLMLVEDHINLLGDNPLMGRNDDRLGPRFPDMTNVYDPALRKLAADTAEELGIPLQRGVFALFNGPCYETAAEIRAYRILGADAIGMSLVPEATAARYLGMHVLGISCITNMATGIAVKEHSHEAVLAAAEKSSQTFNRLLTEILLRIPE